MNSQGIESKKMKPFETMKVVLVSRGALGLKLLFKMDTGSVAEVKRVEPVINQADPVLPGNPIDAVFEIKSLKEGNVRITFYETRPWDKAFTPIIQKEIDLEVVKEE